MCCFFSFLFIKTYVLCLVQIRTSKGQRSPAVTLALQSSKGPPGTKNTLFYIKNKRVETFSCQKIRLIQDTQERFQFFQILFLLFVLIIQLYGHHECYCPCVQATTVTLEGLTKLKCKFTTTVARLQLELGLFFFKLDEKRINLNTLPILHVF